MEELLLAIARDHPELPRLWSKSFPIELGGGWKFVHFQHYRTPLWVTLLSPEGIIWEYALYDRGHWRAYRYELAFDGGGEEIDVQVDLDPRPSPEGAVAALGRFVDLFTLSRNDRERLPRSPYSRPEAQEESGSEGPWFPAGTGELAAKDYEEK